LANNSGGTVVISTADAIGSSIFLAPASKQTCKVLANSSTFLIVPPMLMEPSTTNWLCTGLLNTPEQRAMNAVIASSLVNPIPCRS